jgi:hypothetical protein
MCAKCDEIDRRIEHLRKLADCLVDQRALDGIAVLVMELKAQRAALHPDQN